MHNKPNAWKPLFCVSITSTVCSAQTSATPSCPTCAGCQWASTTAHKPLCSYSYSLVIYNHRLLPVTEVVLCLLDFEEHGRRTICMVCHMQDWESVSSSASPFCCGVVLWVLKCLFGCCSRATHCEHLSSLSVCQLLFLIIKDYIILNCISASPVVDLSSATSLKDKWV